MSDDKKMVQCDQCSGTGKTLPQFETMDEMLKFVLNQPREHPWRPGWFYNQPGDMIEIYLKDCPTIMTEGHPFHECGFTILRELLPDGSHGEIVGVQIHPVLGRLTAEARKAAYIRPGPRQPLKCHVCGWQPKSNLGTLIYTKEPISCDNCGTEFGGEPTTP